MSRARNLKPGFFKNEQLADCHPLTRILFQGLWCEADRRGILEDRPKRLKASILPYDDHDVDAALSDLQRLGFIQRYEVDGIRCIWITGFIKHQDPHYKEVPSDLPAPTEFVGDGVVAFGVPREQRERIYDRDGRKCVKCGRSDLLSIDHIVPRSRGGSGDDSNLQTLCRSCNASKNNRVSSELNAASVNIGSTSGQHRVNDTDASPSDPLNLTPDPSNLTPDSGKTPLTPQPGGRVRALPKPDDSGFDEWYAIYPRHVAPSEARRAWTKLTPDERAAAMDAIQWQLPFFRGCPPDKVPHPTTWLNRRRWEDDRADYEHVPRPIANGKHPPLPQVLQPGQVPADGGLADYKRLYGGGSTAREAS